MILADAPSPYGPKPGGPTGPTPTHPPTAPPPPPNPAPAKTSITVPSVCEPTSSGAPDGTGAAWPWPRGSQGHAAHQTPAVAPVGGRGGG